MLDQVTDFFKSIGNKATNPAIGDVELNRRGAKDSIGHGISRNKAIAYAALPEVIEQGSIIDHQIDSKGRGYETYVIAAPIDIQGEKYYVGLS